MKIFRFILVTLALALLARGASALSTKMTVTPEYPAKFTVSAEKRDDGLIHFTITMKLDKPAYLVARNILRDGDKTLLDASYAAFAHEKTATFYLAVSADRLGDASFEIYEGLFSQENGTDQPILTVGGGVYYDFNLAEFAKTAVQAK